MDELTESILINAGTMNTIQDMNSDYEQSTRRPRGRQAGRQAGRITGSQEIHAFRSPSCHPTNGHKELTNISRLYDTTAYCDTGRASGFLLPQCAAVSVMANPNRTMGERTVIDA
jgi:hypothetical protein